MDEPRGPAAPSAAPTGSRPRTLVEKIWDEHVVVQDPGAPAVLAVDLHLVHEVTSPQAFTGLRERGLTVAHPERTVATADHSVPTHDRGLPIVDQMAAFQVAQLARNCAEFGIPLHGLGSAFQGIVHVIGPELGLTQPGMTIVRGDSHTATHGAFGALAFGIGTSEVEMVLASQCLLQRRPKTYEVRVDGRLGPGVTAKDIILALIARIGIGGGTGHVFEYTGQAIRSLTMEERMTICNMSIEGGARAGLIAPDETTFDYVHGRRHAPVGPAWDAAVERWGRLPSDDGAAYDASITLDAGRLEPMVTYGTNPGMGIPISGRVPRPDEAADPAHRRALEKALAYMDLQPGQAILGQRLDVVFIGSCTNSRIGDLRQAAEVLRGRRVAGGLRVMVVPGSQQVKAQAEREGLDEVFRAAGADWREAGCSMCIAMNGDQLEAGQYALSTSNRNFEGRQGKGGRTLLASPLTAAVSAIHGVVSDPRLELDRETIRVGEG
ncbi:MAG: 3-isopropylmalate dehydratase large subunit [Candidatus Limnocylindrales bacterium]